MRIAPADDDQSGHGRHLAAASQLQEHQIEQANAQYAGALAQYRTVRAEVIATVLLAGLFAIVMSLRWRGGYPSAGAGSRGLCRPSPSGASTAISTLRVATILGV